MEDVAAPTELANDVVLVVIGGADKTHPIHSPVTTVVEILKPNDGKIQEANMLLLEYGRTKTKQVEDGAFEEIIQITSEDWKEYEEEENDVHHHHHRKFAENIVVREATKICKGFFGGAWDTWRSIPQSSRDNMWTQFSQKFRWDPSQDYAVRDAWKKKMKERDKDYLFYAREYVIHKYTDVAGNVWGGENPNYSLLAAYPPDFIDQTHWTTLCTNVWNTAGWKRRSRKNKINRHTEVEGQMFVHAGGSKSLI